MLLYLLRGSSAPPPTEQLLPYGCHTQAIAWPVRLPDYPTLRRWRREHRRATGARQASHQRRRALCRLARFHWVVCVPLPRRTAASHRSLRPHRRLESAARWHWCIAHGRRGAPSAGCPSKFNVANCVHPPPPNPPTTPRPYHTLRCTTILAVAPSNGLLLGYDALRRVQEPRPGCWPPCHTRR